MSGKNPDTCVIIPVYNEEAVIERVVQRVLRDFSQVICVNDGSKDASAQAIGKTKAVLVSHLTNLGQGAALQTGLDYALRNTDATYFITYDADGQHQLSDAITMLKHLREHPDLDIILGSRFLGHAQNIGRFKKWILKLAVSFTNATTGIHLTDAHNGLRVFNRNVAQSLDITMPDMAHASEIIHKIGTNRYRYKELPITIIYTDYSKAKGQSAINAINISFDLLLHKATKK